ncbi:UDPglucose 6-dehydrogenase [Candidatus Kryptonium thompsonii]|uniref:UDP-glucose 6-dehydrogenase n=1 Tax=Candidatus Kryptonium thompsonii TaxID=1633631 RepID=A0A0P1LPS3_9BACT|nr:UDP-glucose/GDP-mannose dehydrogenase family protein [Candidatus Kryptonium thompsoni]CUS76503.1 UDPglucose 6-dehydrogenase [Candidatus Kryptonium thompsoni]CUS76562.1 UDPglucose 6-dehydrogenase [Candidatus Kryptonium thompsoni]CUS76724.1 UDPglucose 6-dehydrogenase [Candidatus Kryptonium thompsoni]CUS80594.1 UDPglucose 6-dehydrogenase [Candidatus Kryptonium thompsoni]CUS82702.1 UDPglucose 6-dehydrogenase [Candidatus Kryptonium thompsoni]
MNIAIIGTGYVGLVTGACFAEVGNNVICMDVDKAKINKLKKGILSIYEPGLEEIVKKNLFSGRLKFTTDLNYTIENSEIIFLCLPTPSKKNGNADLSILFSVVKDIAKILRKIAEKSEEQIKKFLISKSTVPVGTADKIKEMMDKELEKFKEKVEVEVASNPEFLKEGNAVQDFMFPDRVVIGVNNGEAERILRELYEPFVRTGAPILVMDTRSAEMVKYTANAFLAMRISFMNEIANLCERLGADVEKVRIAIGYDNRIGPKFLFPGVGWGGSCFPKDIKALIKMGEENGLNLEIVNSVYEVNERQKKIIVEKIKKHFGKDLKDKKIAVWGLSFKPKTDDMREAPSITIINELLKLGTKITAFDPVAIPNAKKIFGNKIKYAKSQYDALKNADALVLITEWQEFREPDFNYMKTLMRTPVVFDGRNIYNPEKLKRLGFTYYGIGRP